MGMTAMHRNDCNERSKRREKEQTKLGQTKIENHSLTTVNELREESDKSRPEIDVEFCSNKCSTIKQNYNILNGITKML